MNSFDLEAEFADRAVPGTNGLFLLRTGDALALVESAERFRIPILGVDGLFVSPMHTVSPLEHIIDFSNHVAAGHGCWREPATFIESRRELGLVFDVVLGEARATAG